MKIKTVIIGICIFVCIVMCVSLLCGKHNYDTDWMMGKTAEQIQDRYGEFHSVHEVEYWDGTCGKCGIYNLRLSDIWKDQDRYWLHVHFDENGIVKDTTVERGGLGG